jgi:hypothetical protein
MRMTTPPKRIPARDIGQAQPIGHAHYPHISVAASTGLTSGDREYDNVEASCSEIGSYGFVIDEAHSSYY